VTKSVRLVSKFPKKKAKTTKTFETQSLGPEPSRVFVAAILNPSPPNERLRAAAARYLKLMADSR